MTDYYALLELAKSLAKSNLMPADLKNKPEDVFALILQGDEMGLKPMQAIKMLTIIKGKVSTSADGMAALVLRSPECGEFRMLKLTDTECVYRCRRANQTEPTDVSFSWDDAKRAGLTGSGMYSKFPQAMLRARCVSKACKAVFPDLTAGFYDADTGELSDGKGGTLLQERLTQSASPEPNSEATPPSDKEGMHRALELVVKNGKPVEKAEVYNFDKPEGQPRIPFSGDAKLSPFDQLSLDMSKCQTLDELTSLIPRIREVSRDMQAKLKPMYDSKKHELVHMPTDENPGESHE